MMSPFFKMVPASSKSQVKHASISIPAAFFDRFCLWSFWSSSTLPRLVCLAYVRGFYFLFCYVEVSSVVLCLLRCVALHCVVIHYVVLRCVVLRSVVSLLCCIC